MKSFFAIFLIAAALCAAQAYGPMDQLTQGIKQAKNNVNTITNDLKRFTNNLRYDTQDKLSNGKLDSMQKVNNYVNPALNDIRADVDAAKAQGKDAEHCYTEAEDALSTLRQTASSDINKCEQNGKQQLESQLNNLEAAQITGNKYVNELDSIMINCYSSDIFQMQSCVAIKLGTTNQSIRAYEKTVKSMKSTAQSAAYQIFSSADSCYRQAVSVVRSETIDVKLASYECVKN
ncbi:uncharacterized protein LOC143360966 [Halictus rubicundus]|uniref:uncharacterized protein LOC143360966 n=1 Tax=Halictus rubicundus TaxID=77578 RepID=UPI00403630F2